MEKEIDKVEIKDEDTKEEDFSSEELEAETTDWKAKALELKGIAKRRATQLAKTKDKLAVKPEPKPESKVEKDKKSDDGLLEKAYLRTAGITAEDEVELALEISKKWEVTIDKLVDDEDFKVKLEKLRTSKANVAATANVRGGKGISDAKNTPEYWLSKGVPPTAEQVPDRKVRAKIARAMMANAKGGKKFYNE